LGTEDTGTLTIRWLNRVLTFRDDFFLTGFFELSFLPDFGFCLAFKVRLNSD